MAWANEDLDRPFETLVPTGSASLILGKGGTGKTTFGIQFLVDGAKNGERGLLIIGEQSERDVLNHFEHLNLQKFVDEEKIVILDATKSKISMAGSFPSASIVTTLRAEFNSTMMRVFEEIENKGIKRLVMDSLQSFLILTTGSAESLSTGSFAQIRDLIFKIVELCRRVGVTSVFISEETTKGKAPLGFEEYIVDGVLILSKKQWNEKKIREITFDKMRGVRISQDTFLSTMEGGRIRAFPPYRAKMPAIILQPEPMRDPSKDYISTGIEDLDSILDGGYEKGSWNLIEEAHGAGTLLEIVLPLFTNHLNLGRGVIMITPEGTSAESFLRLAEHFVGKERFEKQVVFFERSPPDNTPNIKMLNSECSTTFKSIRTAREDLRAKYGIPVLTIMGLGPLEHMYKLEDLVAELSNEVSTSRTAGDVTVALTKGSYRCTTTVSHMTTTHWKFETINKALTFYGVVPQTEYYAVDLDVSKGYIRPQLIPVV